MPRAVQAATGPFAKLCANVVTLRYGNRDAFVEGPGVLIAAPLLTMEEECNRDETWTDWKNVTYKLREQWQYVNGEASRLEGLTMGLTMAANAAKPASGVHPTTAANAAKTKPVSSMTDHDIFSKVRNNRHGEAADCDPVLRHVLSTEAAQSSLRAVALRHH